MLNFVALFPECRNIELVKDICQIPYVLGKEHDIDTAIVVSNRLNMSGSNFQYVEGLRFIYTPMVLGNKNAAGAFYLLKNAKKIDWLTIYHCGRASYYEAKLYKQLNPRGKVYLKLDMDFCSCDMYDENEWERNLFSKNVDLVDLITVETEAVKERIQPYASKPVYVLTDGYCKANKDPDIRNCRDNSFVTVGRLGTKQKATEVLLEAFALSAASHNWSLKLVGSIEKDFHAYIADYFSNYPHLRDRVIFEGEIPERESLYDYYSRNKVFVLPSRWESFGIVGAEALACGCRLILSDQVAPHNKMTFNGKYGTSVPADDVEALSNAMIEMTKAEFSSEISEEIAKYAEKQFSWSLICDKLYDLLMYCK